MNNFDFREFEQFTQNWFNLYVEFEVFLKKFLLEMAQRSLTDVKERHELIYEATGKTVDTGAMKAAWQIKEVNVSGNNLEFTIVNPQEYASFIEYGARNVNGSWREGYFILTVAIDEMQRQIPQRFQKAWKQFLISKGAN